VLKRIQESTRGESSPEKAEQGEKHQERANTGVGLGWQINEVALLPAEDVPFLCFVEEECNW